jgi:hypothetical protein
MTARKIVDPAGEDGDHPLGRHVADEEREQVPRRPVDPLNVVHHGQHRGVLAEAAQKADEPLEQAGLARLGCHAGRPGIRRQGGASRGSVRRAIRLDAGSSGKLGHDCGKVVAGRSQEAVQVVGRHRSSQAAQGLRYRDVRQRTTADVEARPGQHVTARGAGAGGRLLREPRLADPRLTEDEDELRPAGGGLRKGVVDPAQLDVSANDNGRHGASDHGDAPI